MPGPFGPTAIFLPLMLVLTALFYLLILTGALIIAGRVLIGHWRATAPPASSSRQIEQLQAQLERLEQRVDTLGSGDPAKE